MLTITTPATSLQLLTLAEMREAAGIVGAAQDTALQSLGLRVAAAITAECNVAVGAGAAPTLLRERCTETLRDIDRRRLLLARRHEVAIVSLTSDGTLLVTDDYEVEPESGMVTHLSADDEPIRWSARKIVVVYDAGIDADAIPADLKMAAADFLRLAWHESQRDPALRDVVEDIPGVLRTEKTWWVGSVPGQTREGAVPDIVAGQLKRFRNEGFG